MRKKLLLADDSITIQKVVELTFPSDEFEVVTAGNGRIAVDRATTFLPDMVLCDVIMPVLDGYQVCQALRAIPELKDVPILLLNGAFEPYDADRARSVGALGNVSKPFDPPALVSRVKEILAERATMVEPNESPLVIETLAELGNADIEHYDESRTMDAGVPPATLPHEFSYDESETSPISTMEVPWGVRQAAAQSLALDAPVFAPAEPEAATMESQLSEFSEAVDSSPDTMVEGPGDAPMELVVAETMTELEAFDQASVPPYSDFEAPAVLETAEATAQVPTAEFVIGDAPSAEPMEFETDQRLAEEPTETPETLPSPPPPATLPSIDWSEGETDFGPDRRALPLAEMDLQPEALEESPFESSPSSLEVAEPSAMAHTGEFHEVEPMTEPDPGQAPGLSAAPSYEPPPQAAIPLSTPAQAPPPEEPAEVADTASFKGLLDEAEPNPVPTPASPPSAAPLPSAEIAVPVDMVQQIAQRVISQVSERVIREIAWDVIPGLTEKLIRAEIERIKARAESERD